MKSRYIDCGFILITTLLLMLIIEFEWLEGAFSFALIPLLIAYYFGKHIGRKYKY